jgi:predicted metal-dependent hydrolase
MSSSVSKSFAKRIPLRQYRIETCGIDAAVTHKRVRNLTITVRRGGTVEITAPARTTTLDVQRAIADRIHWVRRTQERLGRIQPPAVCHYESGEVHRFRGKNVELRVAPATGRARVELVDGAVLRLHIDPGADPAMRKTLLDRWYRAQLTSFLPDMFGLWIERIGVSPVEWRLRRMRTRWGTCNTRARRVWLNIELAKVSPDSLEYVIVHELVHLLEPSHNHRFRSLMDRFLPDWRKRRAVLDSEGSGRVSCDA